MLIEILYSTHSPDCDAARQDQAQRRIVPRRASTAAELQETPVTGTPPARARAQSASPRAQRPEVREWWLVHGGAWTTN